MKEREREREAPSAATVHGLSKQTAQISMSSEEVVEDCNPHSLQRNFTVSVFPTPQEFTQMWFEVPVEWH